MKLINFLQPVETMKRVSREELADKLDDLLETVNKENVGFVITNEGKDDLVLCPAKWFDIFYDNDFGCIINSAVRYSLGRYTYMPSTTVQFVLRYIMVLDVRTITVMIEDIDRAIKSLDEDMKQANAVLKMDPKNLDAAKRYFGE